MNKVVAAPDGSAFIVSGIKASAIITTTQPQRATAARPDDASGVSGDMAMWGDDNDFPQLVIADIRKDPDLGPLLSKAAALLYSGGLTWGIPEINEKNEEVLKPLDTKWQKQIRTWMRRSNINRYLIEASNDLVRFANAFPEVVLQNDRTKIIQLVAQPAESCRWQKMGNDGIVKNCYINLNFPDGTVLDKYTKKVPVLDPYFDPAASLRAKSSGNNFIYPLSIPAPGCTYYQLADWNGIRESGWLAVSQAIPKFKLHLLENQLNIKYHVEISNEFWPLKYKGFSEKTSEEQKEIVDTELKAFSDIMTGVERAGNSLVTAMFTDAQFNKAYSLWKITAIENKISKGEYMEEMKEAAIAKSSAVGLHPALVGSVANSGMGGAGSNIREAYNLTNILNKPLQDILLEPLYMVRDFNGWPEEMEFRIRNPFMTTLDTGKELTQTKPAA